MVKNEEKMPTKGHLGKMRWRAKSVLYLDNGDYPENLQIVFFCPNK